VRSSAAVSPSVPGPSAAPGIFMVCVFLLVAIGSVMVFSASAFHWSVGGDSTFFLRRQLAWIPIALLACWFFRSLDHGVLAKRHWQPLAASLALLALVLVVGREVNASRRWIHFGALQFQPSELAKISVIIFTAGFLSNDPSRARSFLRGFLPVCGALLPVFALILVEPDLGTALFVLVLGLSILLVAGAKLLYFGACLVIFAPLLAFFVYLRWETVHTRVLGFLEPEKIYQVKHSLTALGSGGATGLGLGAGGQKLSFLPEPHTDFVLAILGEELGFAGCAAVVLLFIALLWSGLRIAWRASDLFGFLLASGIVIGIAFQAALNMAVVTASAPTKGIPLPFLTFGGSGLCMTLIQVGILLSIARGSRADALFPARPPAPAPAPGSD
jgi:cell division protein FtsW